jgi:PiT family inorganic phosphate transporter
LELFIAITVVVVALGFDFTNGFHDAANAIATSVSTRALKPRAALLMAAVMNLVGALLGTAVATTIAKEIVDMVSIPPVVQLSIVLSALLGAITWNLVTWWLALPSSSSHALIGGLVGAGSGAMLHYQDVSVQWEKILDKVIEPMFLSPVVGFVLAFILCRFLYSALRKSNPNTTFKKFRVCQIFSSAALALGHGLQDAQKSMGIIFMACAAADAAGHTIFGVTHEMTAIPIEIMLMCACAIGLGTFMGGKRIMKTMGSKIIDINPVRAFSSETVSALVLYATAFFVHAPISTTHVVTSAILGSGSTKGFKSVRWGVAINIVKAWFMTLPAAAIVAFIFFEAISLFIH